MSTYTQAQITTMHAAILAEPTMAAPIAIGNDPAVADWLNSLSTFVVWRTTTSAGDIMDSVTWANYTPPAPAAGAGQDALNWIQHCGLKRDSLWAIISSGVGYVSSGKANIRAGIQDAMTGIPAGNSAGVMNGSLVNAGFATTKLAMQRFATNAEKAFATGTGTSATPGDLVFERFIPWQDMPYILQRQVQP